MPSPFPGMDPYLEGSEWHSVHAELSTELARQLGPKLRPKYIARTVRRFVVDLLRQGKRVPMQWPLPEAPYFIFLSRAERRPITEVWPIQLTMPLPIVPVPLLPGDEDMPLDLQLAFTTVYEDFGYDLSVDYSQPPETPLAEDTAVWANDLLQKASFRHAAPIE